MLRTEGGSVEAEDASALEDATDDGGREVVVVQDLAPGAEVLVGREDHRAAPEVALVDDVEEDVGGVGAVGEAADLVHDEDVRVGGMRTVLAHCVSVDEEFTNFGELAIGVAYKAGSQQNEFVTKRWRELIDEARPRLL